MGGQLAGPDSRRHRSKSTHGVELGHHRRHLLGLAALLVLGGRILCANLEGFHLLPEVFDVALVLVNLLLERVDLDRGLLVVVLEPLLDEPQLV